ncbi:ABC transporter, ATP-binding protein [[Clostridium] methylpentosum DSM 5476]|uniref:ABC transporter, ATP-binding protein n=1 Tax=[Clostridium] methylpentosum DSM 5476 TaxID=537013 RepID=C0E9N5_9FIRM|nr:ABC transporter, ATP-binding protein [[Clostridium] methylpentosum DSM 5476]
MLQLKNIVKTYVTGDMKQDALKGVSISFRENEFVSILGQSGSGKTTMLNIIGGLDRYTSGDLVINGVSTKEYKDADWDFYRNNSIGFVFQSYNLIPHQSVLANVEMALTLAGVSKKERKQRAVSVLKKVGLGDHIHKKPNQMSGGQMQRVAIARALVNNPDILLADEPTGALDSETSIQIMELLKEIAKDKLVIMVTHNPELAEKYSTRIVKLLDGRIVNDTNPYSEKEEQVQKIKHKKISMSFFTALSLSFNNLRTKKGRTLLTSFAGSIGIIGIALILALSTGMNAYIADVQKDTMASYPITISDETIDVSSVMGMRGEVIGEMRGENKTETENRTGVFADYKEIETSEKISSSIVENNLTEFKKYLDNPDSEIQQYLGENGIVYTYDVNFSVYSHDADGKLIDSDSEVGDTASPMAGSNGKVEIMNKLNGSAALGGGSSSGAANFSELMAGLDGKTASQVITDSYDVLYGTWPEEYNEIILVLNENNGISAGTLYQLGLITEEQYEAAVEKIENGEDADEISFAYEDICGHTFYLVPACDHYIENENGTFTHIDDITLNEEDLLANAVELKITGIIRPKEDAQNASISTAVAYTSKLTDYVITHTDESAVIKAQEADREINVLTGMEFESTDDEAKANDAKEYLSSLGISEKASFYKLMMYYASSHSETNNAGTSQNGMAAGNGAMDETTMAAALDRWLAGEPDQEILLKVYDEYIAGSTYQDNLKAFGKVSFDAPASISIYTDSFESKDAIAACIEKYNETATEETRITYTDYVAMLTSSITTIINGISYVLVAFVAISLIVSCIMIGIITHISVMERTKEIGILRALGASKRNISQVFNAETFIIGCCAGLLGIGVSLLALIPINSIIEKLSGLAELEAQLPITSSIVLITISILITIIGGLLPAKKAAKKDPVIALRTE